MGGSRPTAALLAVCVLVASLLGGATVAAAEDFEGVMVWRVLHVDPDNLRTLVPARADDPRTVFAVDAATLDGLARYAGSGVTQAHVLVRSRAAQVRVDLASLAAEPGWLLVGDGRRAMVRPGLGVVEELPARDPLPGQGDPMIDELRQQMKTLTPLQRRQVESLLAGRSANDFLDTEELHRTTRRDLVAGLEVAAWDFGSEAVHVRVWLHEARKDLAAVVARLAGSASGRVNVDTALRLPALVTARGLPARVQLLDEGGYTVLELTSISAAPQPASLFEIPPGYQMQEGAEEASSAPSSDPVIPEIPREILDYGRTAPAGR
jgi:hypothetical protein